ncbi:MAG TPA: cobyrinate a,c-diamide synthase [Bryobacteraceae bacterium]|jgi:cobyrinic acid a,c-diamide synthase|nr:cobyrinate a,c-diamide synthase [Bryobacteraceae bacterium]
MNVRRIVVAGTHSGVGKTTIATGLMAALACRGLRVQGFKIGPDFIDPTFHRAATGRASHNLDGWMLSRDANLDLFARAAADADFALVEGVMGMFDGKDGRSLAGTTAEMAMWLDAAVVLVIDASALAGSAAAMVHGFETLVPEVTVAAVVANGVAGAGHYEFVRQAIAARCRAEAIGWLPRDAALAFPERHLGLHLAAETLTEDRLRALADCVEAHIDLDRLLRLAPGRESLAVPVTYRPPHVRIGIARDRAFCFYYEANLDLLRQYGAELVELSPLADRELPGGLDGIYFGGGYPELHAAALAANESMRHSVANFIARDGPVYAECGGFMYLTDAIVDAKGDAWPMVGVFPARARMQARLAKIGYVEVETACGAARGHEFRHSTIDAMPPEVERAYADGYRVRGAVGSYVHLHFGSCRRLAEDFVERCERWRSK